jgi:hypothetical protein
MSSSGARCSRVTERRTRTQQTSRIRSGGALRPSDRAAFGLGANRQSCSAIWKGSCRATPRRSIVMPQCRHWVSLDQTAALRAEQSPGRRGPYRRGGATLATADADLPSLSYAHLVGDSKGPGQRGQHVRGSPGGSDPHSRLCMARAGTWSLPCSALTAGQRARPDAGQTLITRRDVCAAAIRS